MSEEILKALSQLFAIVTKQDDGATEAERSFVHQFFRQEVDQASVRTYLDLFDQLTGYKEADHAGADVSVQDSIRILAICKRINRTLIQRQKAVVLIRLLELMATERRFTEKRMEFFHTVAMVFHLDGQTLDLIKSIVMAQEASGLDRDDVLIAGADRLAKATVLPSSLQGLLVFAHVRDAGNYLVRYSGTEPVTLNGQMLVSGRVYGITHGGVVKAPTGDVWYFSDLVSAFNQDVLEKARLCFQADIQEYRFPNGAIGLRPVTFTEGPGNLVGIMGASGAGKTTLLNVLAGVHKPSRGHVRINGFDLHERPKELEGVVGFVAQDDLLIEELTVFQNLYYNARLCCSGLSEDRLKERVMHVLADLGLDHLRDLRVGTVLDKMISGGQRKRLNIALELIREPSVLFLDEPTSGLSSRDSEHVIDLLKELSLKGKLVMAVIHQPSSDIFKVFDKMLIMDEGGYAVYYGQPVEAVNWFRQAAHQVDQNQGYCGSCGNVNPEQIFNILEARVVDEYGQAIARRKILPAEWHARFLESHKPDHPDHQGVAPHSNLRLPGRMEQAWIFFSRDLKAKLSNRQYMLINLLEAPVLGVVLAWIIKYPNLDNGTRYVFRYNENIPAFFLMAVVVSLFLGLMMSAEEIIRDRKILRRESFLNLSRNSYLTSKLLILFGFSAIQMLLFVVIGNWILEIRDMVWPFWLVLFSASCFAVVLGLNISSAFNSAVTVYILIPVLLIPQMILSGVLFSFDRMQPVVTQKGKVPLVADMMASRWAYEAMAVVQTRENAYQLPLLAYEESKAEADYKSHWLLEVLRKKAAFLDDYANEPSDSLRPHAQHALSAVRSTIASEPFRDGLSEEWLSNSVDISGFDVQTAAGLHAYLDRFEAHYTRQYNEASDLLEAKAEFIGQKYGLDMNALRNACVNEELTDLVRNIKSREPVADTGDRLVRQATPVYARLQPAGWWDYRTPFFAPYKNLLGITLPTLVFNVIALWVMAALLYILLFGDFLARAVKWFGAASSRR